MDTDESLYHATPQTRGKIAHTSTEKKTTSTKREVIDSMAVYSNQLGVMGVIDTYNSKTFALVERKYQLKTIYQGQYYQLWAQYFCLIEMGYRVDTVAFYEISTNRKIPVPTPKEKEYQELMTFIQHFRQYNPATPITTNPNKCKHCIYCSLCDKTEEENVYT